MFDLFSHVCTQQTNLCIPGLDRDTEKNRLRSLQPRGVCNLMEGELRFRELCCRLTSHQNLLKLDVETTPVGHLSDDVGVNPLVDRQIQARS